MTWQRYEVKHGKQDLGMACFSAAMKITSMTEIGMTDTTPTFMKDVAHSMITMESITNTMVEAMMENTTKAMAITIMEVMDIDRHADESHGDYL